ncbi:ribosomal protein S27 [Mactra antiquata]
MATSMIRRLGTSKLLRSPRFRHAERTILSDAFKSEQVWKERLTYPFFEKINAKEFGIEMLTQFEQNKNFSPVDVQLFANKIQDLSESFEYVASNILLRYRHCDSSVPVRDDIMHAIVRGYIDGGHINKLLPLIKDKAQYGIFPDEHSMCLLLDQLLEDGDYARAAQMAYEVMLQEEYDYQMRNLLALTAAIKHFCYTMDFVRKERDPVDPDEDIEYVAVKVITNPYYDDHFDIKDERFLLGKTLYNLSKNTAMLDPEFSRSLQLIGLGLYEKFELANQLLEDWVKDSSLKNVVYSEALKHYEDYLNDAPTRDPEAEPVSMSDKTLDDEIELLKLTPTEKGNCISKFESLKSSLKEGQTPDVNIEDKINTVLASSAFKKLEKSGGQTFTTNFKSWMEKLKVDLDSYITVVNKQNKMVEIHNKLVALQEREELLRYFENSHILKKITRNMEEETKEEEDVVEYVAPPGQRNIKKAKKKKF